LDLEWNQILNTIYAYLLLENALVQYCGEGRKANRFCLRLQDAEGLNDTLVQLFQLVDHPFGEIRGIIAENNVRYASMNIGALLGHGTLEVRAMRGTNDEDVLVPWLTVLRRIRQFGMAFPNPQAVLQWVEHHGVKEFTKLIFDEHYDLFKYDGMEADVHMAASLTYDLPYAKQVEYREIARDGKDYRSRAEFDRLVAQYGAEAVKHAGILCADDRPKKAKKIAVKFDVENVNFIW